MGTKKVKSVKILSITAIVALLPLSLMSQNPFIEQVFIPEKGTKGKDVIWLPSPDSLIIAMLEMAKVGHDDVFLTLGRVMDAQ